ncbi:MAG TPA: hypothetical protein VFK06_17070 [Candidatus Angelobacter sp.]|nr:hypothetical protein [Candidatus Angelobacter sp.]
MTNLRSGAGSKSAMCLQAAEFISALCDGESIPREVARHIGQCDVCQLLLQDYIQMGVELKRLASAEAPARVKPVSWTNERRSKFNLWKIWRESMRIPRVAFALMVVVIAVLSFRIASVHATGARQWLLMHVWDENGKEQAKLITGFAPDEKSPNPTIMIAVPRGTLGLNIVLLGESEGAANLGIRALYFPPDADKSKQREQLRSAPMKEITCVPGQKTPLVVEGYGSIEIGAEVLEKLPEGADPNKRTLFPPQGSLNVSGPLVLLNEDKVVSKAVAGAGQIAAADGYFALRAPGNGRYVFAARPFDGAVEGQLNFNQIQFKLDGQSYLLLAGSPVAHDSQQQMWVRHDLESGLQKASGTKPTVEFGLLSSLAKK